jgi:hypothetical protein
MSLNSRKTNRANRIKKKWYIPNTTTGILVVVSDLILHIETGWWQHCSDSEHLESKNRNVMSYIL